MSDKDILKEYVSIAITEDLRALALEYAVTMEFSELEVVVVELKVRYSRDKQLTEEMTKK